MGILNTKNEQTNKKQPTNQQQQQQQPKDIRYKTKYDKYQEQQHSTIMNILLITKRNKQYGIYCWEEVYESGTRTVHVTTGVCFFTYQVQSTSYHSFRFGVNNYIHKQSKSNLPDAANVQKKPKTFKATDQEKGH